MRICGVDVFRNLAADEQRQRPRFLPARAGAQRDAQAERFEQAAEIEVMLLGEDLRGRHERGLVAGFDAQEHRAQRDERLAASRRRRAAGGSSGAARRGRRGFQRWLAAARR